MPRGFTWSIYTADDGRQFAIAVDSDYAIDPDRGFLPITGSVPPVLPRGFTPRVVRGHDDALVHHRARVGSLDAPLWTGAATHFAVEATDGTTVLVPVEGRTAEHERRVN